MSRSLPPLNWIRAFECAAKHLSFTAAAIELNLTQSAISQQVRSLETRLGTVLFNRKARGLALTDSGRCLLPYISGALGHLEEGIAKFNPYQSHEVLKITCSTSFSLLLLAPRLNRFLSVYPTLNTHIVSALWPDDYLSSEADVEIRFGSKELVGEGATLLSTGSIIPVCMPEVAKGLNSWSDICQMPLVQTVGTADTWQSWADDLNLESPPPMSRSVDSSVLAIEFARNENCIALVHKMFAEKLIQSNELVVPLGLEALARDNHFIAITNTPEKAATAKAFRDWITTEIQ